MRQRSHLTDFHYFLKFIDLTPYIKSSIFLVKEWKPFERVTSVLSFPLEVRRLNVVYHLMKETLGILLSMSTIRRLCYSSKTTQCSQNRLIKNVRDLDFIMDKTLSSRYS